MTKQDEHLSQTAVEESDSVWIRFLSGINTNHKK